ncbi:MAG: hypothetical protein J0L97_10205 [Alphaproteobacteria bacterium]|nr:hypothetical protein [Alphaproteobacteria bacterium]
MEKVAMLVNLMEMSARTRPDEPLDPETSLKKLRKELDALQEKDPDVSLAPSLMVEQASLELRGKPTRALQEEQLPA